VLNATYLPSEELEDVEIGYDGEHNDKDDEQRGEGLENPHHQVRDTRCVSLE